MVQVVAGEIAWNRRIMVIIDDDTFGCCIILWQSRI